MASVSEQLAALNNADLSKLNAKLKAIRKEMEEMLKAKGEDPNRNVSDEEVRQAASQAGVSVEEFLRILEWAKKVT